MKRITECADKMREMHFGECHAHLLMDAVNYRKAAQLHKTQVNVPQVRDHLRAYQHYGVRFVRDGGDAYGVSVKARELAPEYGIDYRSPIFAIHQKGHYGGIVGRGFASMAEFAQLVREVRAQRGDFIKIMVSGIMEYEEFGRLSEPGVEKSVIREMIHIAHESGYAVMVHGNGSDAVRAAVLAGADSIEHGNYIDRDCIDALADSDCVWVPTIVTTGNLLGCGRYEEEQLERIFAMECENLAYAYEKGAHLALGSDAGAYLVPHGKAVGQELEIFRKALGDTPELIERLKNGERIIREKFQYRS
ncbi:MAG: amidohydrolase family protein [Eubacteriales bacterium]|nr:amidohydrolase family protein [Eubacteriales bacterium]